MNKKQKLYALACVQPAAHARSMCYYNKMKTCLLPQDLYKLTCEINGVESLSVPEILPTFFTEEAIEELLNMPNIYWFWCVVKESVMKDHSSDERIGLASVKLAMAHMRSQASWSTNLRTAVSDLTQAETAFWVASGFLLIESGASREKLVVVRNPIYEYEA